jgi:hypothetical protein
MASLPKQAKDGNTIMYEIISGAIMMGSWIIASYFYIFWRQTSERLLALFSISFVLLGIERLILGFYHGRQEDHPAVYFVRLLAYVLIIVGVFDKNVRPSRPSSNESEK